MYDTLIDCATVRAHLDDPQWLILDCRFDLGQPAAGEAAYAQGHLPGARYVHLDRDLSAKRGAGAINGGRHPLPARETIAARFGALGVGDDTQVVLYDASGGTYAARAWWMLRWIGHANVAVLDGGLPAWQRAGGALVTTVPPQATAAQLTLKASLVGYVDATAVQANIASAANTLIDARGPDRYDGSAETIDPVGGHIPGAINLPFAGNLDANGCFKPAEALRTRFAAAIGGKPVIHQCGSGVTACHNLLAMKHAGLPEGVLYGGSWSEWIEDPTRPRWTPA